MRIDSYKTRSSTSSRPAISAFNKIRNYQKLKKPEDTVFTPNVGMHYIRISLDLRTEPAVVTLPPITPQNRYYAMQAISLEHYNLEFTGARTIGQGGRVFASSSRHIKQTSEPAPGGPLAITQQIDYLRDGGAKPGANSPIQARSCFDQWRGTSSLLHPAKPFSQSSFRSERSKGFHSPLIYEERSESSVTDPLPSCFV
jgi:hypothetical protein